MPYKHYYKYSDEFKIQDIIEHYDEEYILFVHGGTFFQENPRKSYYEILLINHFQGKLFKEEIVENKLTPNSIMLIGLFKVLNELPKGSSVKIIIGTALGFEKAINRHNGVNYDYILSVLNMIEHKELIATIYSLPDQTNEVVNIINNPSEYSIKLNI